nr:rop guanine nucleotide exchange factor 9-like isoform X2 [Lolium perenne]XP_051230945.1 rop guanine nucleotide exchange factor 9-like isoform X2 [Lolium perenne]
MAGTMEVMITQQRKDLQMNIPALRKLDMMLLDARKRWRGWEGWSRLTRRCSTTWAPGTETSSARCRSAARNRRWTPGAELVLRASRARTRPFLHPGGRPLRCRGEVRGLGVDGPVLSSEAITTARDSSPSRGRVVSISSICCSPIEPRRRGPGTGFLP